MTDSIRTVYIAPSSHLDIGFTAPADVVADEYKPNLDRVLYHLDRVPGLVWNIEEVWMLEQWLSRTPDPAQVEKLMDHIRSGRLGLLGGWATEHSALLDAAELAHFLYPAEELRRKYGLALDTILQNDVPGYSWSYPGLFAAAGYAYFLTGLNLFIGGGTSISRADLPFYWEGADGSRILTWVNFDSYVEGLEQLKLHEGVIDADRLNAAIARYTDAGYPYDAILIQHSFDNMDIDGLGIPALQAQIEAWNAAHAAPKLRLAAPGEFFRHMVERYRGQFKTYRGDWAGRWEEVKVGSPYGHALVRRAKADLLAGATLGTLVGADAPAVAQVDDLYRDLLWWDEHSVGSPVPWPNYFTEQETHHDNALRWETAQKISREARALRDAAVSALACRAAGSTPGIVVVNPLAWERGGPVTLALPEGVQPPVSLRDEATGALFRSDASGRDVTFVAPPVPPLGYRRFTLEPAWPAADEPSEPVLENTYFRVSVDAATGNISSIYDQRAGRELVRTGEAFNALLLAEHGKGHPRTLAEVGHGRVTLAETAGARGHTLTVERTDTPFVRTRITLYADQPWVEWTNEVDRSRMREVPPGDGADFYLFGFPFALSADGLCFRPETPAGYLTPGEDQLPGANGRGWTVQRSAALSETNGYTVVLAAVESFLFYVGDASAQGAYVPPASATVYAALMSKADYGLLKGGTWAKLRDGEPSAPPVHRHTFRLATQAGFDPVAASRAGWELASPLAVVSVPPAAEPLPPAGSLLSLDRPNVMVVEIKPATFGERDEIILRLQEIAGRAATVTVQTALQVRRAWLATPVEQPIQELPVDPLRVPVGARAMVTLRLACADLPGFGPTAGWHTLEDPSAC